MKEFRFIPVALVSAFAFLAASCEKEITSNDDLYRPIGSKIVFTVSTEYENGDETKAEYSGVVSTSNSRERIDWVAGDPIKIIYNGDADGYTVTGTPTASGASSKASITGNLEWKAGPHTFLALYPNNSYGSLSTAGVVKGTIPADQSVTASDLKTVGGMQKYQPHTASYGYMVGYKYIENSSTVSTVELPFKPAFTTFEFKLKGQAASSAKVTKAVLSSQSGDTGADMTGSFQFTISGGNARGATWGTVSNPGSTARGRSITINFPSGGVAMPTSGYLDFSFLTLPINQKALTLTLYYTDNTTLVLRLKDNMTAGNPNSGTWHTFTGAQKYVITNDYVPNIDYTFGTLSNVSVPYTGGSRTFASSFVSYKSKAGSSKQAVPFTLEYSTDGSNWSSTPPAWLTTAGMNTSGSTTGVSFSATAEEQVNSGYDPHHTELVKSSRAKTNFDLATYNVATGGTVDRTTANCYVVRGSGTYRLPLVYGNAIKNGDDNPDAYWARNGVNGARRDQNGEGEYLGRFKDHLDQNITATYITQQHSGKTLTAELLWTDEPGLVKNVGLTGSGVNAYLTFEVPSKYITQGNAVVAVLANGVIAWSWHIWVTEEDLTVSKAGSNGYNFPTVNIGWCEGKTRTFAERKCYVRATQSVSGKTATATFTQTSYSYTTLGNGPFYQWGRKDPMWASDGNPTSGTESKTSYCSPKIYYPTKSAYAFPTGTGLNGSAQYALGYVGRVSIGTAIQHPTTFYCNVETATDGTGNAVLPADWNSTIYLNKWSSTINGNPDEFDDRYGQDANGKTKTIYDPSPVGFRVPVPSAWSDFSSSTITYKSSNDKGFTYNSSGLFFPCAGDRFSWSAAVHYVGQYGYYWTTIPSAQEGNSDAHRLMSGYTNNPLPVDVAYRATALSVRPVRE